MDLAIFSRASWSISWIGLHGRFFVGGAHQRDSRCRQTPVGSEYYLRHLRTSACGTRGQTGSRGTRPRTDLHERKGAERQFRPQHCLMRKEEQQQRQRKLQWCLNLKVLHVMTVYHPFLKCSIMRSGNPINLRIARIFIFFRVPAIGISNAMTNTAHCSAQKHTAAHKRRAAHSAQHTAANSSAEQHGKLRVARPVQANYCANLGL